MYTIYLQYTNVKQAIQYDRQTDTTIAECANRSYGSIVHTDST